jgi:hypothetical protein
MRLAILVLVPLALAAGSGEARAQAQRLPIFPYERIPVAFRSVHSGMCLDVRAAGGSGAALQQYPCHDQENQSWFLLWTGDADYQLRPGHQNDIRLGIAGDSTADGANAQLIHNDPPSQSFQLVPEVNGTYSIRNKHSGKCLDVPGWSTTVGEQIQQWWCSSGTNQRWEVIPRARPFHLRTKYSTYCVGVTGASTSAGAQSEQQDCLGTDADHQEWIALPVMVDGTQYWRLRNANSGLCLTNPLLPFPYDVVQRRCSSDPAQFWSITGQPDDGTLELRNVASSNCLDTFGSAAVGSLLHTWPCSGSDDQRFAFQRYVRRHVLLVQPATSAGANRYIAYPWDIQASVDRANAVYRRWGVELLYDPQTDHVDYDSDALHNLHDITTWGGAYACDGPNHVLQPGLCGDHVALQYPDRVVIVIGPGADAGYAQGYAGGVGEFFFLRPGHSPNACGTGQSSDKFAHELGHYFGLSHVFAAGHADGWAAGAAYTAAGNTTAVFDGDRLADTWPDPIVHNTGCLAPSMPWAWTWLQGYWGSWPYFITAIALTVSTENVMSYYFHLNPAITPQQAAIVGATAYMRGL